LKLYLDSSALVKLVQVERESEALREFLGRHGDDQLVTSALSRVEVVRAVTSTDGAAAALARLQLEKLEQLALGPVLLDQAASLRPGTRLRSLDVIHLASALIVGHQLRAVVTYDDRVAVAAHTLDLRVESPR
jgi:uncharacterized protein